MKNVKIETNKQINGFNRMMTDMLLNGTIMKWIHNEETNEVLAKITTIRINGDDYFAFWYKDFFDNDYVWLLHSFGDAEKVEKVWIEYRDILIESGLLSGIEAA